MFKFGRKKRQRDELELDHSGYVDIHCHILPGIDDGAQFIDESLALAKEAIANGITDIVATPHLNQSLFPFSMEACEKSLSRLREALKAEGLPIEVHFGAEVKADPSILEGLKAKTVPTLGSSKYVLIELPFEIIPPFARELVFEIQLLGLKPILAHPERNLRIQRNPDLLQPFIESGCLTQLNSTSVTGHLGKDSQDSSFELLTKGWASIIASDAHKAGERGPNFIAAVNIAAGHIGGTEAQKLVRETPAKVLH